MLEDTDATQTSAPKILPEGPKRVENSGDDDSNENSAAGNVQAPILPADENSGDGDSNENSAAGSGQSPVPPEGLSPNDVHLNDPDIPGNTSDQANVDLDPAEDTSQQSESPSGSAANEGPVQFTDLNQVFIDIPSDHRPEQIENQIREYRQTFENFGFRAVDKFEELKGARRAVWLRIQEEEGNVGDSDFKNSLQQLKKNKARQSLLVYFCLGDSNGQGPEVQLGPTSFLNNYPDVFCLYKKDSVNKVLSSMVEILLWLKDNWAEADMQKIIQNNRLIKEEKVHIGNGLPSDARFVAPWCSPLQSDILPENLVAHSQKRQLRDSLIDPTPFNSQPKEIGFYERSGDCQPAALVLNLIKSRADNYESSGDENYNSSVTDCANLCHLFDDLGYEVKWKETAKSSELEEEVKKFAKLDNPWVLAINGLGVGRHSVKCSDDKLVAQNDLVKLLHNPGKEIKPRLIVFNLRESDYPNPQAADASDPQANTAEELEARRRKGEEDANWWRRIRKEDGDIPFHKRCGLVIASYTVPKDAPSGLKGSAFVRALCHVYYEHAQSKDVVSMINDVNRKERELNEEDNGGDGEIATWIWQTHRHFFLGRKTKSQETDDSNAAPECTEKPRVLIINNRNFPNEEHTRCGSEHDVSSLKEVFPSSSFTVVTEENRTSEQMLQLVENFSNEVHAADFCVLVVMSHGEPGFIVDTNGELVDEGELLEKLISNDAGFNKKFKFVVFQACRKNKEATEQKKMTARAKGLPRPPNTIVAHSTSPGDYSWRHTENGSRFIQILCAVLEEHARSDDVISISKRVNYLMIEETKKISYYGYDEEGIKRALEEWQLPWWRANTSEDLRLLRMRNCRTQRDREASC